MRAPRILIGATGSGSGKTTITCALLEILKRQGKKVQAFKCGPDYIDPMFHRTVLGIPSKNLDTFFTGEKMTAELFMESAVNADISVMEGVMGLYDGLGGIRKEGSAYDLATVTDTPVILVIDAHGMGRSILPLIAGFLSYDTIHLFCFYYEDNLKALEKAGAEIVFFSPLHDGSVPKEADGLLLPGGYPELYAKELSENKTMLADIREKAELAMPIVAECGGFMYLHQTMEDTEHHVYEMAGVVPGDCFYTGKLVRFGYIELTEKESNFLPENGSIKGHEFHYFDSTANGDDCVALKPVSGKKYDCVFDKNSCFVGFPHLYYPSAPQFAENFVKKAKNYADRSEVNS